MSTAAVELLVVAIRRGKGSWDEIKTAYRQISPNLAQDGKVIEKY